MIDDRESRWRYANPEVPKRMGKVDDLDKFDADFFGFGHREAHAMDPQTRILLEHTYEALLDAGVGPKSIRGRKIGVFVGNCFSDAQNVWFYQKILKGALGALGYDSAY